MDKLKELIELCGFIFNITYQPHRGEGKTAEQYFEDLREFGAVDEYDISGACMQLMIRYNSVFRVRVYPISSIGFFESYDYDLERAIDDVIKTLKADR